MERIGFVGLGIMGKPMARRLLSAGFPVTVYNRSQAAVDEVRALGATVAESLHDVAKNADVVVLMLPDTPDVEAVVVGAGGLLEAMPSGSLLVDMSTISPTSTRHIASRCVEHGVRMLDAPVSGGETGAIEGTLSIMVGGAGDDLARVHPLFDQLGKSVTHIGGAGAGQTAKAANQAVVAVSIQAVAEALTLASRSGVDPVKVREALLGGLAQSRILDVHGQRMIERAFQPGFRVRLHRKDLAIALETAKEHATPIPLTAQVAQLMHGLDAMGHGDSDHSALKLMEERLAGM